MVDDTLDPGNPPWRIILFLAGASPRSRRARVNLRTLLQQVDYAGGLDLEEVDALQDPARALAHGIVAIPAAVLIGPDGAEQIFYGDLGQESDQNRLLEPLATRSEH